MSGRRRQPDAGRGERRAAAAPRPADAGSAHWVQRHGVTHALIGESAAVARLRGAIRAVAASRASLLLCGETGTGKGLVARLVHALRGVEPFVHVDCSSLAPSVIESELFGHERGAFTGAGERRSGRLERAGRGTLFLDEVAEVEPGLQAKLLRVLQDRCFERVGGSRELPFRARVIAATNRDLAHEIAAGRFRRDLYYRLQVVELRLPPLRERPGDVELLLRWALERSFTARGRPRPELESGFHARLLRHPWPGNVRELLNVVERLSIWRPAGPWRAEDAERALGAAPPAVAPGSRAAFAERERAEIARLLERHRWNVSATARALGISRGALRGRMSRLGLS